MQALSRASASLARAASILTLLVGGLAACGGQTGGMPAQVGSPAATAAADVSNVIRIDDGAGRVMTLSLDMGSGPSLNGFNFDGLGKGRLQIVIPVNWTVHVDCRNTSPIRHSCGVIEGAQTSQLAFPGAATPSPAVGIPPGQSASFTFAADRTGSFRIACLVPGHLEAGMWASLEIGPAGTPSVRAV